MSKAMEMLEIVWRNNSGRSWECVNHAMSGALSLAIDAGLPFGERDWFEMGRWRPECWRHNEECYSLAVAVENMSAIKCIESALGRVPIVADGVTFDCRSRTLHANTIVRNRCRLIVGATFQYRDLRPKVTSFADDGKSLTACTYTKNTYTETACEKCGEKKHVWGRGKIEKRFKITRQDILADRKQRKAAEVKP